LLKVLIHLECFTQKDLLYQIRVWVSPGGANRRGNENKGICSQWVWELKTR